MLRCGRILLTWISHHALLQIFKALIANKSKQNQHGQIWICSFAIPWNVKIREQRNRKFPSKSVLCGCMPSSTGGSRSCIPTLWSKITFDSFSIPHKVGITCHTQKFAHYAKTTTTKQEQFWIYIFVIPWKAKKQEQRNRKFPSKSPLCGYMPRSTGGSRSCIPTLWSKITLNSFSIPQKVGITCHTQKSAHYAIQNKINK